MMRLLSDRAMGISVPWWWGYAWRRYDTRESVLIVIPFNWVVGTLRQWYLRLLAGPRNRLEESIRERVQDEWSADNGLGYKEGREAAWRAVKRQVELVGVQLPEEEP